MAQRGKEGSWTLLTSHGHVLVEVARNPQATIRELADAAGITERATLMIVADLVDAGYLTRERVGRRNRYEVHLDRGFRHAQQRDLQVGPFLDLLTGGQLSQVGAVARSASELL
jgi:DNA-binding MarR family transcriptional regulator